MFINIYPSIYLSIQLFTPKDNYEDLSKEKFKERFGEKEIKSLTSNETTTAALRVTRGNQQSSIYQSHAASRVRFHPSVTWNMLRSIALATLYITPWL